MNTDKDNNEMKHNNNETNSIFRADFWLLLEASRVKKKHQRKFKCHQHYICMGTEVGDLKGSQRQKCFTPISGLVVRPLA